MTLNETVLQKLAEWPASSEGRHSYAISHEASGWSVHLTSDRQDLLSCALWEIVQTRQLPKGIERIDVARWAEHLAAHQHGALGRLEVIEVDVQRDQALIRSKKPMQKGADLLYFEVLLSGRAHASVRRYQGSHESGRRKQIPFVLTHENVAQLATERGAE